mgnify:CR=1 FL=1
MASVKEILGEGVNRKTNSVEALKREFDTIRTGRPNPAIVEHILVDYYGTPTPINQLASISVSEARTIVIQPWDRQSLSNIEKAVLAGELGLNPANDGNVLRLIIPQLTEDRRKDLVKLVRRKAEDWKIELRNIRRDVLEQIRFMVKNKEISEDDSKRAQEELQKNTDQYVARVEALASAKEEEVMAV